MTTSRSARYSQARTGAAAIDAEIANALAAMEAALAKRQAARNPHGCNPDTEFQAGWEAARSAVCARTEWGVHYPKYIGSGRLEIDLPDTSPVLRSSVTRDTPKNRTPA